MAFSRPGKHALAPYKLWYFFFYGQEPNADGADKAQQSTFSGEPGMGTGRIEAAKVHADLESISSESAARARMCPPKLPAAVQELLHQSVAFMQEQSSVGSEALVRLLAPCGRLRCAA